MESTVWIVPSIGLWIWDVHLSLRCIFHGWVRWVTFCQFSDLCQATSSKHFFSKMCSLFCKDKHEDLLRFPCLTSVARTICSGFTLRQRNLGISRQKSLRSGPWRSEVGAPNTSGWSGSSGCLIATANPHHPVLSIVLGFWGILGVYTSQFTPIYKRVFATKIDSYMGAGGDSPLTQWKPTPS